MSRTVSDLATLTARRQAAERVMRLVAAGVPLSLLLDLAAPAGPDSASINLDEQPSTGGLTAIVDPERVSRADLG